MSQLCPACDGEVPPATGYRPRKYCSTACRAWAYYHPGEKRQRERSCAVCGADISHRTYKAKTCSQRCDGIMRGTIRAEPLPDATCATCSTTFPAKRIDATYCSDECREKGRRLRARTKKKRPYTDADRDRYHRKRARRKQAATGEPVRREEIAARDKYRCGVCRKKVNMKLQWPHPMSPSLDHIDPLSLGGPHDPANIRLTHLQCNVSRGNRGGGEQLALVG